MPFGSSQWMYNSGADFYNGVATQSLRFDNASSSHLKGTLSASFNTYTFSAWIKRSTITSSYFQYIFSSGSGGLAIGSTVSHTDKFYVYDGTTAQPTDAVYRDASGWYHVVLSSNSGTGVLYVNGVSVKTGINCASTSTTTNYTMIGYYPVTASALYFDGYMADVNFIDGTAIGDSDADGYLDEFGELKNGVWIPKAYTGSYGTNGFRLEFKETGTGTGSTTTIGADTSGNLKHFDSSGVDTEDCNMPDSPENNFCTSNALDPATGTSVTLSEGNLKNVGSTSSYSGAVGSTFTVTSGKWYWEVRNNTEVTAGSNVYSFAGCAVGFDNNIHRTTNSNIPSLASGVDGWAWEADGDVRAIGTGITRAVTTVSNPSAGDVLGFAMDLDNGNVYFYLNGVAENSGNAVITGVTGLASTPMVGVYNGSTATMNFGQDSQFADSAFSAGGNADENGIGDFKYSVPSGYLALCSANISDDDLPISPNQPTQAEDNFNVVTYSGTGSTQTISDVGFNPDFIWFNRREASSNLPLYDSTRGGTNALRCNTNGAEAQFGDAVIDFTPTGVSTGFEIAGTNVSGINGSGETLVAWNWKANGGVTSTISADSVTTGVPSVASTVQANTDAGFSIVTFPANNTNGTKVGHGLDATPKMIIAKEIDNTSDWFIYHEAIGNGKYVHFNNLNSEGELSSSTVWGSADPDDDVFTIGNSATGFAGGGTNDALAYCFAEVEGYSKFGSFTGGGSNLPFIYLGFRPRFFMMFLVSSASLHLWFMYDTERANGNQPINPESYFSEQSFDAETSFVFGDFLSNGIKIRTTNSARNGSGGKFIYMAFAENPFKYANAR